MVDSYSASAIINVWDAFDQKKRDDWMNKHKGNPAKMADLAFKLIMTNRRHQHA